jgi:hypothetical protein
VEYFQKADLLFSESPLDSLEFASSFVAKKEPIDDNTPYTVLKHGKSTNLSKQPFLNFNL